jgi:hypothetical protein
MHPLQKPLQTQKSLVDIKFVGPKTEVIKTKTTSSGEKTNHVRKQKIANRSSQQIHKKPLTYEDLLLKNDDNSLNNSHSNETASDSKVFYRGSEFHELRLDVDEIMGGLNVPLILRKELIEGKAVMDLVRTDSTSFIIAENLLVNATFEQLSLIRQLIKLTTSGIWNSFHR